MLQRYLGLGLARARVCSAPALAVFACVVLARASESNASDQYHQDALHQGTSGSATTQAFCDSFFMILATELGDKTFFIAALLASRHGCRSVFAGALGALAAMTVLSATIGFALPALLPAQYTHWASIALFVFYGVQNLFEAGSMIKTGTGRGPSEELAEVEKQLKEDEKKVSVAMQAFTLTFVAEWGDRSQIATIALAASKSPAYVTLGGIAGHSLCTSIAVFGGKVLAAQISERLILSVGGVLFLLFAVHGTMTGAP